MVNLYEILSNLQKKDTFFKIIYMIVSEVGLIARGSFRSEFPDLVTHATSGVKPSTWSFSVFNAL